MTTTSSIHLGSLGGAMWWRYVGFKDNPYFGDELDVSELGQSLFVGRKDESVSLLIDMSEADRALIFVGGISGSGKTSFLNHGQYACYVNSSTAFSEKLPKILPCFSKIQVRGGEEYEKVLLKILSACVSSIEVHCQRKSLTLPSRAADLQRALNAAISQSGGWGFGASVFGSGGTVSRQKSESPRDATMEREDSLIAMITDMRDVAKELGFDGIAVVIDNFETLTEQHFKEFLDYARDSLFHLKGIWWFIVGQDKIGIQAEALVPRLKGFMTGTGINILPSEPQHVAEMLARRRDTFAIATDSKLPVPEDVSLMLYGASGGDLRFTFSMCASIVRFARKELPSATITDDMSNVIVQALLTERLNYFAAIPRKGQIVSRMLETGMDTLNSSQYEEFGYMSPMEFEPLLREYCDHHMLWSDVGPGGVVTYTARGYLQLALNMGYGRSRSS